MFGIQTGNVMFALSVLPLLLCAHIPFAHAEQFEPGALIIPMDTDYQDYGMLKAYGLVYEFLMNDIQVHWAILEYKSIGDVDFTASARDFVTHSVITEHGYRGGAFLVAARDSFIAEAVVDEWLLSFPVTVVHEATAAFAAPVVGVFDTPPRIAMLATGQQSIAREYLTAAWIPNSLGGPWTDLDALTMTEAAGGYTDHSDGALFDASGEPLYDHLIVMHWSIDDPIEDEVVAEIREFLQYRTSMFAACQAAHYLENHVMGQFLSSGGLVVGSEVEIVDYMNSDFYPAQMDGPFEGVSGANKSYSLNPEGGIYHVEDCVMITGAGTPPGTDDVFLAGFIDGECPPAYEGDCATGVGVVTYLGGHQYSTNLPISAYPESQGVRLFLNSIFRLPPTSLSGVTGDMPRPISVEQNYPNPFNPQTVIAFNLLVRASVSLRVFDVAGHLVDVLIDEESVSAGRSEIVWSGRDMTGRPVPSGTYFYRLTAGGSSETRRMVLVK